MTQLQELRHQSGWTQQDMANEANVDVRTVKRWEADDEPPERVVQMYQSLFGECSGDAAQSADSPVPLEDVMAIVPDPLPLKGRLSALLGSLPRNEQFTILLGGASGAGKSTAALILAGDLADHGAVLLATSEERLRTGTIGRRAKHARIDPDLIDAAEVSSTDDMESLLDNGDYTYVIIDSINELGIDPDTASRLFQSYPKVSFILIAQADASEKRTVGGARWRHLVDVRLWCERDERGQRIVKNLKNRFGPTVDEVTLDKGRGRSLSRTLRTESEAVRHDSLSLKDPAMDDTYRWMVGRLEAELTSARQEIRELRSQLEDRDEQLREAEVEIARFESREQILADGPRKGLGDSFDPEKLASIADKFAPLIGAVTEAIVNRRSQPPPHPVGVASPYATPVQAYPNYPSAQPPAHVVVHEGVHPFDNNIETSIPGITS